MIGNKTYYNIFGVVDQTITNRSFKGIESETANVIIDMLEKTIKVDVKTDHIIGTGKGKAYPSELGNETLSRVLNLEKSFEGSVGVNSDGELVLKEENEPLIVFYCGGAPE